MRLEMLMATYPRLAPKNYSLAEVVPPEVLTRELIRATVRNELAEMARAFLLEQWTLENLTINKTPFLVWEQDPSQYYRAEAQEIEKRPPFGPVTIAIAYGMAREAWFEEMTNGEEVQSRDTGGVRKGTDGEAGKDG